MLIVTLFGKDCFLQIREGNISLSCIVHLMLEFISKFDLLYNLTEYSKIFLQYIFLLKVVDIYTIF